MVVGGLSQRKANTAAATSAYVTKTKLRKARNMARNKFRTGYFRELAVLKAGERFLAGTRLTGIDITFA